MSSLSFAEKLCVEKVLHMSTGFVLNFTDKTFGEFIYESIGIEIHNECYCINGTSKAKKLRAFWEVESDYLVGRLLDSLLDYAESLTNYDNPEDKKLALRFQVIVNRLLVGGPKLVGLKERAEINDSTHLAEQIRRIEDSVENDPSLAVGTSKELVETCCKTILSDRNVEFSDSADVQDLTRSVLKELKLVPEEVPNAGKGAKVVKRILNNLGTIGFGIAELRGLFGTGHGKHGKPTGISPRHAKLAVGSATTLAVFLFETHEATR